MLSTPLISGLVFTSAGDAPAPEWKIGDKWEYQHQMTGLMINSTTEVTDITKINVNGSDYEVYKVKTTSHREQSGGTLTEISTDYYIRDSLALVKTEISKTYPDGSTNNIITHYFPPKQDYVFPLDLGKTWSSVYNKNTYNEIGGYINSSYTVNYTIVAIEPVKVKAGEFDCYKIEIDDNCGTILYVWYSPEIKNIVKTNIDSETLPVSSELTSYSFGEKRDNGFDLFSMPYILFLVLIPIIIILLIIFLVRGKGKKKKRKKGKRKKGKKKRKKEK